MRLLTLLLILMFALVAAYFCYSVYFYGGRWIANPYNPRISSQKQHVVMGTLTDRDGTVLAYTDESGTRRYNSNAATRKAVSQVVGDSSGKVSTGADTFHAQYPLEHLRAACRCHYRHDTARRRCGIDHLRAALALYQRTVSPR